MTWNYAYTPYIWPSVITISLLIVLAGFAWRRRQIPGALPLLAWALIGSLSMVSAAFKAAAVEPSAKITWFIIKDLTLMPSVTAAACFVLEYVWPGRWLTRRNLVLLALPCLLVIFMEVTNGARLMWSTLEIGPDGSVAANLAPTGIMITIYGLSLFLLNVIALLWLFVRSPQHRWPVALMLFAQAAVRVLFMLQEVQRPLLPPPVFDVVSFILPGTAYALALFGFRLLDPVAMARLTLMEQLSDGMLVLDRQGRVVSLNQAAEAMLGVTEKWAKGKLARELLPACNDGTLANRDGKEIEFCREWGPEESSIPRYYTLTVSVLNDWRGHYVGHLLLLRDISEQKRTESQLLEQQRALAMLMERERLAHELHDDLGQVLAFISTQGQVVQQLLVDGEVMTAGSYLARLVEATDEADTDIRENILSLQAPFSGQGLVPALQDYLRVYEQRYGLHIEVVLPKHSIEGALEPVAEVQILRILQEGLANARKHAEANCVQVAFTALDGSIQITMWDDGKGFEPVKLQEGRPRGFGLQFMRERAEAIGGRLEVRSAPGKGTEIQLIVPLREGRA